MLVACIFDDQDISEVEKAEVFVAAARQRLEGDSAQPQQAADVSDQPQGQPEEPAEDFRAKMLEIAGLECGKLIRGAFEHFRDGQFDIKQLAPRMEEEVSTLHSWAAQLGKSCKHRGVEVFQRHGGSPLKLSIRPEARRVLQSATVTPVSD